MSSVRIRTGTPLNRFLVPCNMGPVVSTFTSLQIGDSDLHIWLTWRDATTRSPKQNALLFGHVEIDRQFDFVSYHCGRILRSNSKSCTADRGGSRESGMRLLIYSG